MPKKSRRKHGGKNTRQDHEMSGLALTKTKACSYPQIDGMQTTVNMVPPGTRQSPTALLPKPHPDNLDECSHTIVSGTGAMATCFFLIGLLMFLVAFASHDWLGLEKGLTISLWQKCTRSLLLDIWGCHQWDVVPDFVRAAQGFCVVGLLTYALSVVILIAYLMVQFLQRIRAVLIALCLLIFASGCMTLMALVVMGIKGNDYLQEMKADDSLVLEYYSQDVDIGGSFYIGWSFIVAVISAFVTLASFMFCMIEFVQVSDTNHDYVS